MGPGFESPLGHQRYSLRLLPETVSFMLLQERAPDPHVIPRRFRPQGGSRWGHRPPRGTRRFPARPGFESPLTSPNKRATPRGWLSYLLIPSLGIRSRGVLARRRGRLASRGGPLRRAGESPLGLLQKSGPSRATAPTGTMHAYGPHVKEAARRADDFRPCERTHHRILPERTDSHTSVRTGSE